jgi:diguanylate cyclase (GGDEF)-like protein/PAS domain S-box-containing protein
MIGKKCIMVVEDEGITAMSIQSSLEEMGYEVTSVAVSGEEAIQKAGEDKPDLVLMDIELGSDINGIQAAGTIHSRFNIPIVYLTAHTDDKILKDAKITEPFGYIIKPFDDRELSIAVEIALYKHKMEERLRESEIKYRTLFDCASDAIYLIDPGTQKILDCNPRASELIGYTVKELRTMTIEELHPAEEQDVISKIFRKVSKKPELSGISGINQFRKNGALVPVEINATTIDLKGKKHSLAIVRDISERKRAEQELKESKERYRTLFQRMSIGCALHKIIVDKENKPVDYVFMKVNDAFVRLTGLKRASVIGKKATKVMPEIEKSGFDWIGKCGKVAQKGGRLTFEQYSEPLKKWFSISAYRPMPNHFITLFQDITDRKIMEDKLKSAALTDELTGLLNRRGFIALAEQQRKMTDRTKMSMSLIYIDLNGLKIINDRLGHLAGDQALIDTSNILKKSFREADIIARMGGDEFAVLLTDHGEIFEEKIIVNNLRDKLRKHNEQGAHRYELSLSIGMAQYETKHPCSIDKLLNKADILMYKDKKHQKTHENMTKQKMERRTSERFNVGDKCHAVINSSDKMKIYNISLCGIRLESSLKLIVNNRYKIRISASGNESAMLTGKVVWSYMTERLREKKDVLPCYETALKFINMNKNLQGSLENFIDQFTD